MSKTLAVFVVMLKYRQHRLSVSEHKQLNQMQSKQIACEQAWLCSGIEGLFAETTPWRPIDSPSRHRYLLKYGWQFFNQGQRQAAIVYGIKAICELPVAIEGWKLLGCALIKPVPAPFSL